MFPKVHHIQNCFYDTLKCMKKVKQKKKKTRWKPRPLKSRQRAAVTAASSEEAAAGGGDSSLGKREGKVTLSAPPAAAAEALLHTLVAKLESLLLSTFEIEKAALSLCVEIGKATSTAATATE